MRKNTARHWLHAALDLLPVLTIPIFAIYITNHEPEPISITYQTQEVVDFNQLSYDIEKSYTTTSSSVSSLQIDTVSSIVSHKYLVKFDLTTDYTKTPRVRVRYPFLSSETLLYSDFTSLSFIGTATSTNDLWLQLTEVNSVGVDYEYSNLQFFDLTQIYGVGNEPSSVSQFDTDFPLGYYPFTLSETMAIDSTQVLYDDTDIGSQYIYQLYNVTDKYFNMGNVFNLGNVYEWFNVNIFYGQSPFVMSIVYNIIVYEFVMDLLFLLYGLFMWFIDICKVLIEKPINSIK